METEDKEYDSKVILVIAIIGMVICLLLASNGVWNGKPCDSYSVDQRGNVCD